MVYTELNQHNLYSKIIVTITGIPALRDQTEFHLNLYFVIRN